MAIDPEASKAQRQWGVIYNQKKPKRKMKSTINIHKKGILGN